MAAVIFPSLLQLQRGITDLEDRKQREICSQRYKKRGDEAKGKLSELDIEREEECGICMEMNSKVVLPNCNHTLCMKCYWDWYVTLPHSIEMSFCNYFRLSGSTHCLSVHIVWLLFFVNINLW